MRPVSNEFPTSQNFGDMATAGVVGNVNASSDTVEYWVGLYGDYQPYGHAGMDIACPIGTPIYAPADGVVLYAGWTEDLPGTGEIRQWLMYWNFGGILTAIQHDGWISFIAHQSNNDLVYPGMGVKEGQLIGYSGNTKTRTTTVAAHVHAEALVYMDYRTRPQEGIIYGRVDPSRFFGGIAAQGSITEEEDMGHVETVSEDAAKFIARKVWEMDFTNANGKPNRPIWILQSLPETLAGQIKQTVDGVLRSPLKWLGFDGKQPTSGRTTTTVETAVGYGDTIAAAHTRMLLELKAVVDQLALGQGVTIDYQAIAKAVVDEEARRLQGKEGA